MIKILVIILFLLMLIIGGERGVISIITLIGSVISLLAIVILIVLGVNPLVATALGAVVISALTLLYQNKKNKKTVVSFISVMIILMLFFGFIYLIGSHAKISGFNEIEIPELMMYYSDEIHINMMHLGISIIIIGLLGAVLDTSMAISSGMYEVYENNKYLNCKELFASGISIGKDILGSTVNTLFFAYIGESVMLFNLFKNYGYTFLDIINSKSFLQYAMSIIFSGIGCVLVIPMTAALEAYVLTKNLSNRSL